MNKVVFQRKPYRLFYAPLTSRAAWRLAVRAPRRPRSTSFDQRMVSNAPGMAAERQMELSLTVSGERKGNGWQLSPAALHKRGRQAQAHWWFQHMRQIVDRAFDWEQVPESSPAQVRLPESQTETARQE